MGVYRVQVAALDVSDIPINICTNLLLSQAFISLPPRRSVIIHTYVNLLHCGRYQDTRIQFIKKDIYQNLIQALI